ncbi:MAG: prepilin-type N-terminal cleavage/methylation domain-containing protein [Nitrospiraceae bacterium]|nr:prepilin-type N-terminal cleavage/methylation domain-containing protein [Nitrospiraceae bacterium]
MKKNKGFTLLEVLVAVAIMGGLLITIIDLVNHHLSVIERYQTLSVETMLAKEKLIGLRAAPREESGSFPEPYSGYSYKSDIVNGPLPFLNELVLTVRKGRDKTVFKMMIGK